MAETFGGASQEQEPSPLQQSIDSIKTQIDTARSRGELIDPSYVDRFRTLQEKMQQLGLIKAPPAQMPENAQYVIPGPLGALLSPQLRGQTGQALQSGIQKAQKFRNASTGERAQMARKSLVPSGNAGAMAGEFAGQGLASFLPPHAQLVARPALAMLGAGLGKYVGDKAAGNPVTKQDAWNEAIMTGIFQGGEEVIRGLGRLVVKASPGGKATRRQYVVDRMDSRDRTPGANQQRQLRESEFKGAASEILSPPGSQAVSNSYQNVYDSNMVVYYSASNPLSDWYVALRSEDRDLIRSSLTDFARDADLPGTGPDKQAWLNRIIESISGQHPYTSGADIQALDQLRQYVYKQAHSGKRTAVREIMSDFGQRLDRLVVEGTVHPRTVARFARETGREASEVLTELQNARYGHLVNVTTKHLDDLMHSKGIYVPGEDARFAKVHLGNLKAAIEYPADKGQLAKEVSERFKMIPGAYENFLKFLEEAQKQYRYIELEMPRRQGMFDTPSRMLSEVLMRPTGQAMFKQLITEGRGRVSFNHLAGILNILRRYEGSDLGAQISNPLATLPVVGSKNQEAQPGQSREPTPAIPEKQ